MKATQSYLGCVWGWFYLSWHRGLHSPLPARLNRAEGEGQEQNGQGPMEQPHGAQCHCCMYYTLIIAGKQLLINY